MIVLALDTSGPSAGVALLRDGQLCYEATVVNRLTHSVNLMPMVEEGLRCAGVTMPEVD
ncbi:MAG: tRNA (adenosine(37)-N6)-threonylcarbamoyltransferase complex dimerization subunit type 1 TsaB, partial [Clostridiales bacterium]|nr:tRNA (adenosine(37)-N6)-threonylcarbamoyltransferase complex dimerization subunit type 1 TsaB [Clostridiales bacterium]